MSIGEVLLGLPTGVFTIGLVFCLTWWVSSFALGGLDSGPNTGNDAPVGFGHSAGRTGGVGRVTTRAHGAQRAGRSSVRGSARRSQGSQRRQPTNTAVPVSLRWTIGTSVAWSVSLIGSLIVDALDRAWSVGRVASVVALALVALLAVGAGNVCSKTFSRLTEPMFVTPQAPSRSTLIGAHARVRSLEISADAGEAKVVDGRSAGAIVRVRSDPRQRVFRHGELVQLISYDEDAETYEIDDADVDLLPDHLKPS